MLARPYLRCVSLFARVELVGYPQNEWVPLKRDVSFVVWLAFLFQLCLEQTLSLHCSARVYAMAFLLQRLDDHKLMIELGLALSCIIVVRKQSQQRLFALECVPQFATPFLKSEAKDLLAMFLAPTIGSSMKEFRYPCEIPPYFQWLMFGLVSKRKYQQGKQLGLSKRYSLTIGKLPVLGVQIYGQNQSRSSLLGLGPRGLMERLLEAKVRKGSLPPGCRRASLAIVHIHMVLPI